MREVVHSEISGKRQPHGWFCGFCGAPSLAKQSTAPIVLTLYTSTCHFFTGVGEGALSACVLGVEAAPPVPLLSPLLPRREAPMKLKTPVPL